MRKICLFIFSLALLTFSCEKKASESTENKATEKTEVVKHKIDSLTKRMDMVWTEMMKADDKKFDNIKRLLEEISYTKQYDASLHDELMARTDSVRKSRYTQETMTSKKIDEYDDATTLLIKGVQDLMRKTPEISSHPLADELMAEIQRADGNELIQFRKEYDHAAFEYNKYVRNYGEKLKELGPPYNSLQPREVFSLAPQPQQ